jgi:hypothetical protein
MGTIGFTTWDACELQTHWHEAEHSGQDIFPWKSMLVVPNVLPLLKRSRFDRKILLYLRLFHLASSSIIWHLTQQFHHWYSFRNIWKHFETHNHNNRGSSAVPRCGPCPVEPFALCIRNKAFREGWLLPLGLLRLGHHLDTAAMDKKGKPLFFLPPTKT